MIDSTLVGLIGMIIGCFISMITKDFDRYYNIFIFYFYKMQYNPLDIHIAPYRINIYKYKTIEEFLLDNKIQEASLERSTLKIYGSNFTRTTFLNAISKFLDTKQMFSLRNPTTNKYLNQNNSTTIGQSSAHVIAIGKSGWPIYLAYISCSQCIITKSMSDYEFIENILANEIIKYISDIIESENLNSGAILLPTFPPQSSVFYKSLGKISKKKTFDTLFYNQKEELITILDKFKTHTLYPSHIPMDNKLGILLYGPPGTGKTGTISAIANMLGRSIVLINFTKITTCSQLDEILNPTIYNKYVYVFDEFDCILDVICGSKDNNEKKSDWGNMLLYAEPEERKEIIKMMKESRTNNNNIDLAYLLQKLDGLESGEDRIIIATTNNPDKINPTLLRPGRFDFKICLGHCTKSSIIDILTNFYKGDDKVRENICCKLNGFNGTYTPLEIINMAIQHPVLDNLLQKLNNDC